MQQTYQNILKQIVFQGKLFAKLVYIKMFDNFNCAHIPLL